MNRTDSSINKSGSFSWDKDDRNPLIPVVALSICGLYLITLVAVYFGVRKQAARRPKLVVACDIQEFEALAYYLISVETGKKYGSGTDCYVYCFLCGGMGNAGPFPLNDASLETFHLLQRNQEDNYLVSHKFDLGEIQRLVICYENKYKSFSEWSCSRITVRNVKTGDNWFFFMSSDIRPKRSISIYKYFPADREFLDRWNKVSIDSRHFIREMTRYHAYISPFIYPTPERITLLFAEIMSYMGWLIFLFGFPDSPDPGNHNLYDINGTTEKYVISMSIIFNKSATAALGILCGTVIDVLFEFSRVKRIPTLLVLKKSNMPLPNPPIPIIVTPPTSIIVTPPIPTIDESAKESTNESAKKSMNKSSNKPIVQPSKKPTAQPSKKSTNKSSKKPIVQPSKKPIAQPSKKPIAPPMEDSDSKSEPALKTEPLKKTLLKPASSLATGDSIRSSSNSVTFMLKDGVFTPTGRPKQRSENYYELVEMDSQYYGTSCNRLVCLFFGWILCFGAIISSTIVCYVYGGKYGEKRSADWLLSFLLCFLENFFVYQFIKILVVVAIITLMVNKKKLGSFEAEKLRRRIQIEYADTEEGAKGMQKTYKLKHNLYLPEVWEPIASNILLPEDFKEKSREAAIHLRSARSRSRHKSIA